MPAIRRMTESPYPSQNQDKFVLRLPDGMRDRIKRAAEKHNRSMNAEIVATLAEVYPAGDVVRSAKDLLNSVEVLVAHDRHLSDSEKVEMLVELHELGRDIKAHAEDPSKLILSIVRIYNKVA